MKRHLVLATALPTIMKIALTFLCCTLLMLFPAPSRADVFVGDQCAGALNEGFLGTATGCGALITVTAIDDSGRATAFTVTRPGNGNPYDSSDCSECDANDDTLVGIQNNTDGLLKSIILSSPTSPIFGFDGDGPCNFNESDCFSHTTTGYEGPNNTFTPGNTNASGTVNFFTPHSCDGVCPPTPGIGPHVGTWFALEGTPQSLAGHETQILTFNPGTNVQQQATFDCGVFSPTTGCSSGNAHSVKLTYDKVNFAFQVQINVTPVDGDGVCPIPSDGNANENVPTDNDCTLANFFGSTLPSYASYPYLYPAGGSVNTPFCLHYLEGGTKCAEIEVILLNEIGGESSGFLHLYFAWNENTTTLFNQAPAGSYVNFPQLYDGPHNDQDTVDYPPAPKGYPYPGTNTDLQKVFLVSRYYNVNGIAGLDGGVGTGPPTGVKKPNHYIVAFPFAAPDSAEWLISGFPHPNRTTTCYPKGLAMLVSFEIEHGEQQDPKVQTPSHPLGVTVLQDGAYQNIGDPTVSHLFGEVYAVLLSNANLPVNNSTTNKIPYQLQVSTDLIPGPLTQNFVVLKSCF